MFCAVVCSKFSVRNTINLLSYLLFIKQHWEQSGSFIRINYNDCDVAH